MVQLPVEFVGKIPGFPSVAQVTPTTPTLLANGLTNVLSAIR